MSLVTNTTKTLEEMRDMVYFLISESPNSTLFSTSNVNKAINMGLNVIGNKFDRSTTNGEYSTTVGQSDYQIPEAILQYGTALVDNVYINDVLITPVDYPSDNTPNGEPTEYHVMGNVLRLSPTPDDIYTVNVEYRKEVTPLVLDTDSTWLPDIAVNAAIFYACYLMKLKDEEFPSADRFLGEYETQLKNTTMLQSGVYRNSADQEQPIYGGAV